MDPTEVQSIDKVCLRSADVETRLCYLFHHLRGDRLGLVHEQSGDSRCSSRRRTFLPYLYLGCCEYGPGRL